VADQILSAKRERVTSFVGVGCLIQAAALFAPFVLYVVAGVLGAAFGAVLMIVLFVIGSNKAISWRCGGCKNPVASKDVAVCPVCRATLHK
jgi:hypothetical protein